MTKVEAYKAVIAGEITEDVVTKFEELLAAHEKETLKRRETANKKREEKLAGEQELVNRINEMLTEEPLTASDIAKELDVTPQKATILAKRSEATQVEVKRDGRKVKGYVRG